MIFSYYTFTDNVSLLGSLFIHDTNNWLFCVSSFWSHWLWIYQFIDLWGDFYFSLVLRISSMYTVKDDGIRLPFPLRVPPRFPQHTVSSNFLSLFLGGTGLSHWRPHCCPLAISWICWLVFGKLNRSQDHWEGAASAEKMLHWIGCRQVCRLFSW